ncbi:MAG: hypothetical protein IJ573_00960 [Clostridia bacterium]|nr:hypothetical protein [Clostridia bacterium]
MIRKTAIAALLALFMLTGAAMAEIKAGDIITFGSYEQDNDQTNGKEPIEWVVMEVEGGDAMLLSRYVLDILAYNDGNMKTSWKKSSLRSWLNSTFYDEAFTGEEKAQLLIKELETKYDEGTTADPVTLMTCPDALRIFENHQARQCVGTEYAKAKGLYQSKKYKGFTHWWTRNPSWESYNKASYVAASGGTMKCGAPLTNRNFGVRPLIYLKAADFSPAQ